MDVEAGVPVSSQETLATHDLLAQHGLHAEQRGAGVFAVEGRADEVILRVLDGELFACSNGELLPIADYLQS